MMTMIAKYWRYARLGTRLLFPGRNAARYARAVRDSGLFDRAWYLATNPRLPLLCKWLPERHYVLVGEAVGLCPGPRFSPRAYAHLNPDQGRTDLPPLAHYLAHGQHPARAVRDFPAGDAAPILPAIAADDRPDPPAPVAIVLHLYYQDMWDDFARRLRGQRFDFDLFVTLSAQGQAAQEAAMRARIRAEFPQARIWTLPNHGRDILPFLHLARSGVLAPYGAICKLHTKKSPHRDDGLLWRDALLDGVLGAGGVVQTRLAAFLARPEAGLWVADGHRMAGVGWWGPNWPRARDLAHRAGILLDDLDDLVFAAGSIYWIKPAILTALAALPVGGPDFELEMGQVDGTTAHALERLCGAIVQAAGLRITEARELDQSGQAG